MHRLLVRARDLPSAGRHEGPRPVSDLLAEPGRHLTGTVVQISGPMALTVGVSIMAAVAARARAPGAIVAPGSVMPYAPDLEEAGITLAQTLVVAARTDEMWADAVDLLVRSRQWSVVLACTGDAEMALPASFFARAMHRCAASGVALLVVTPRQVAVTAATVALHIETGGAVRQRGQSDGGEGDAECGAYVALRVRRSREPYADGTVIACGPDGMRSATSLRVTDSASTSPPRPGMAAAAGRR